MKGKHVFFDSGADNLPKKQMCRREHDALQQPTIGPATDGSPGAYVPEKWDTAIPCDECGATPTYFVERFFKPSQYLCVKHNPMTKSAYEQGFRDGAEFSERTV